MAGSRKPNINVTRIKMSAPQGYVLGRTSPGIGPLELIPIFGGAGNDIGSHLVAGGAVAGTAGSTVELGFFVSGGPMLDNAYYAGAKSVWEYSLPSAAFDSSAKILTAPTADMVLYLVYDLAGYAANGPLAANSLASVTFAAAAVTGTIAWYAARYTVTTFQALYLAAPHPFDLTAAGLSVVFVGDTIA